MIPSLKRDLRAQLRARLAALPVARRAQLSAQARALLVGQPVWRNARAILFYAPLPDELDLLPLVAEALAAGKTVALPRFTREHGAYAAHLITDFARDCAPGRFGICEPRADSPSFPLKSLDLALVPGVGFDAAGHRLGRGRGFYDRLLAQVAGTRCGVAFDEQLIPQIPAEPHDIHLNCILTPTQWVEIFRPPPPRS